MKNSFKHLLVAILVLAAVVLPVIGSANSYKATETTESTEVEIGTQGVLTAANMYDWNFGAYNDIIVFMSYDDTQTLSTLTGQTEGDSFAWFYNFMLEYNAEKGVWVVTKADMTMEDSANQLRNETLGEGKMVVMFHDLVTTKQQESYDFFMNTVEVGAEFYLGIHPDYIYDVYDYVDGAFLSTVPVEVEAPEVEDTTTEDATTEDATTGTDDKADDAEAEGLFAKILAAGTAVVVLAALVPVAIIGAIVVVVVIIVKKRKNAK